MSTERLVVDEKVADTFVAKLAKGAKLVCGGKSENTGVQAAGLTAG